MSKDYDATMKRLVDTHLQAWADFLARRCGVPLGVAQALDTDFPTTVQTDRLLRIGGPSPALLHVEFQVNHRLGLPVKLLQYNALAYEAHRLPVHSTLILLRPQNPSDLTGRLEIARAGGGTPVPNVRVFRDPRLGGVGGLSARVGTWIGAVGHAHE